MSDGFTFSELANGAELRATFVGVRGSTFVLARTDGGEYATWQVAERLDEQGRATTFAGHYFQSDEVGEAQADLLLRSTRGF